MLRLLGWEDKVKMPPTGKLPAEDVQAITEWVKNGAIWPGSVAPKSDTKGNSSFEERKKFWAFQPVKPQTPPAVKGAAWAKSAIDKFVLAKLEEKGLAPAAPADKMTLLRRVTFDLTGLPPTEQEMRAFAADSSPEAFRKGCGPAARLAADTARSGAATGSTWRAMQTRPATTRITGIPTPGDIAIM